MTKHLSLLNKHFFASLLFFYCSFNACMEQTSDYETVTLLKALIIKRVMPYKNFIFIQQSNPESFRRNEMPQFIFGDLSVKCWYYPVNNNPMYGPLEIKKNKSKKLQIIGPYPQIIKILKNTINCDFINAAYEGLRKKAHNNLPDINRLSKAEQQYLKLWLTVYDSFSPFCSTLHQTFNSFGDSIIIRKQTLLNDPIFRKLPLNAQTLINDRNNNINYHLSALEYSKFRFEGKYFKTLHDTLYSNILPTRDNLLTTFNPELNKILYEYHWKSSKLLLHELSRYLALHDIILKRTSKLFGLRQSFDLIDLHNNQPIKHIFVRTRSLTGFFKIKPLIVLYGLFKNNFINFLKNTLVSTKHQN